MHASETLIRKSIFKSLIKTARLSVAIMHDCDRPYSPYDIGKATFFFSNLQSKFVSFNLVKNVH